ncbi:response regulator transcription factor [Ferrimonas lipolytica]|uniref:Helix-turn-helix transcriptional regulator n=1 Tax=Ferrimonas lipolytica TaxID=2724191 RepID=A0A6H1UAS6_9GAMM|nr:helix-turn-helix transcriptional regulator [Ferrimonas lipolytica]QIZ75463.1 helix-turn-helix transcriptional regulator [Ferrimonas lipolytica]
MVPLAIKVYPFGFSTNELKKIKIEADFYKIKVITIANSESELGTTEANVALVNAEWLMNSEAAMLGSMMALPWLIVSASTKPEQAWLEHYPQSRGVISLRDDSLLQRAIICISLGGYWLLGSKCGGNKVVKQQPVDLLTTKELEVLSKVKLGCRNSTIAAALCMSEHTVKSHLYHIFRKLNVHSRTEAVALAFIN